MYNQEFYAQKSIESGKEVFNHFFTKLIFYTTCGKDPIYRVKTREVEEGEESQYWGWKDFEKEEYDFIFPSKLQTKVCSFDFFKSKIEANKGELVNLVVEEIELIKSNE